jgi:hypothetical protein
MHRHAVVGAARGRGRRDARRRLDEVEHAVAPDAGHAELLGSVTAGQAAAPRVDRGAFFHGDRLRDAGEPQHHGSLERAAHADSDPFLSISREPGREVRQAELASFVAGGGCRAADERRRAQPHGRARQHAARLVPDRAEQAAGEHLCGENARGEDHQTNGEQERTASTWPNRH